MTHRFHPLAGQDFEFVAHRQNWGEDRVHLHDGNGELFSLPAGWTDAAPADPFAVIADGRCPFTTGGLLALADLIDRLRSRPDSDEAVKRITPRTSRRLRRCVPRLRTTVQELVRRYAYFPGTLQGSAACRSEKIT